MADTVDWKDGEVGPADKTRQQSGTVLDSTIMMQKTGAGALNDRPQLRSLMRAPAHIENDKTGKIESAGHGPALRPNVAGDPSLGRGKLAPEQIPFAFREPARLVDRLQ